MTSTKIIKDNSTKVCGNCKWQKRTMCFRYPPTVAIFHVPSALGNMAKSHVVAEQTHPVVGNEYPACGEWKQRTKGEI